MMSVAGGVRHEGPPNSREALARRRILLRRLSIRCPVTGLASDIGLELTALPNITGEQLLVDCLECGQDHVWRIEDCFLG
jgi:hypothetical protein